MPLARITSVGGDLYHVHVLDATDPGFGGGRPGGADPGFGRPEGGRPGQGLPGGGHPGQGIPDHELPDNPPPHLLPGYTLVMVRGPHGKWEYAFIAPGDPPPKPLPPSTDRPDNTLPGQPGRPPVISGGPAPPPGRPPMVGGGPVEPRPPHVGGGPVVPPEYPTGGPVPPTVNPTQR